MNKPRRRSPRQHQTGLSDLVRKIKRANTARKRTRNLHPDNPIAQGKAVVNAITDKKKVKSKPRKGR